MRTITINIFFLFLKNIHKSIIEFKTPYVKEALEMLREFNKEDKLSYTIDSIEDQIKLQFSNLL